MRACPVDAISVDMATGAKVVSDDKCVGCKVCTIACPFGTINYSQATGKVVKCDLCGGDPWCAKACPTSAISYVDSDNTGLDRMRAWAQQSPAGPASYNTPHSPTTPADFTRRNSMKGES